jgi:hypothetical protein
VRAEVDAADTISPIAAAGVVGGVESLLYDRINREDTRDLEDIVPSLMYFVVLPFEGQEAARGELSSLDAKRQTDALEAR